MISRMIIQRMKRSKKRMWVSEIEENAMNENQDALVNGKSSL